MSYTDIVVNEKVVEYKGVLDFTEFLKVMKEFFKKYDYGITEKSYSTKNKDGMKNTKVNWQCDRKYDNYNEAVIKFKIDLSEYKEGFKNGKKLCDGNFKIKISGEIKRDYGDKWRSNNFIIFIRQLYDKYISTSKNNTDKELENVVNSLIKEIKEYLQI